MTLSGDGTQASPWLIQSTSDLRELSVTGYDSYMGQDKYFQITADLDFTGEANFTPIGNTTYLFNGNFNGLNHKIIGMNIVNETDNYTGLFKQATGSAQISNIIFKDCTVTTTKNYCGMLLGQICSGNGANIFYIETDGCKIESSSNYVGGITGDGAYSSSGSVKYEGCYVHDGYVKSSSDIVGGITGYGANSSSANEIMYKDCVVERETVLSSSSNIVGGIAGFGANSSSNVNYVGCKVLSCVVQASSSGVGGITGIGANSSSTVNYNGCVVDNTYVVSSSSYHVGGIAGYVYNGGTVNITDCSVTKCTIKGTKQVGGIVGYAFGAANISNPILLNNNITGTNTGANYVGGCAGRG